MSVRQLSYLVIGLFALVGCVAFCVATFSPRFRLEKPVTLKGHAGGVTALEFSATGQTIASGGDDKTVNVWSTGDGKRILTFKGHAHGLTQQMFSPDSRTLASAISSFTWNSPLPRRSRAAGRAAATTAWG
jgi:WD40 repeat protein